LFRALILIIRIDARRSTIDARRGGFVHGKIVMNKPGIHAVTVYCSSSRGLDPAHFAAGREMGRAIAQKGWTLVYGGNYIGLMGAVADGAREGGGKVIGITPQLFIDKGLEDRAADELVVADSMRHRKQLMEHRGDAFVALPGGLGTFEEIFEIIVGKQLTYHAKPIVLLNTLSYWNPLLDMIEHGVQEKFIKPSARNLYHVAVNVEDAINHLQNYTPGPLDDTWHEKSVPSGAE